MHADATFPRLETMFGLRILAEYVGKLGFIIIKQNKEASSVLCSAVRHSEPGRALTKSGETLDCLVFSPTS